MSRWIEQFNNHPFQKIWLNIKSKVKSLEPNDQSIDTEVDEINRLNRVIEYLDGIIDDIDPEITPYSIWNNVKTQSDQLIDQLNSFEANKNISHIQQANNNADNLLTYIKPYLATPKGVITSLKRTATIESKKLNEKLKNFSEESKKSVELIYSQKDEIQSIVDDIKSSHDSINEFHDELLKKDGMRDKFNDLQVSANKIEEKIKGYHERLFDGDTDTQSIKNEVQTLVSEIRNEKDEVFNLLEKVNSKTKEFDEFYLKVFGDVESEDGMENDTGYNFKYENLLDKLIQFETEQQTKYKALNEQIEGLLPDATSAGLASAYSKMVSTFDKPIKNASFLFYATVISIFIIAFIGTVNSIYLWGIDFKDFSKLDLVFNNIVSKLPLYLPLLWLAYFASKRRSEYKRLEQEYAHKETIARSYQGYKKQIEELQIENDDLKIKLLNIAIEAIGHNASKTLDGRHGDKMPSQSILENLVSAVMNRTNK